GGFPAGRRAPCRAAPPCSRSTGRAGSWRCCLRQTSVRSRWSRSKGSQAPGRAPRPTAKEEGYGAAMPERLFLFMQLEFPWELGPPGGRSLLRRRTDGEPERVVVIGTLGARLRPPARAERWRGAGRTGARGKPAPATPAP